MKARATTPVVSYASAVKAIRLAILPKMFPEQILNHEEQKTIDDIPREYVVTVYLPKNAALGTEELVSLLIAQNDGLHTRLWRVIRSKVEDKDRFLTFGVNDRSLEQSNEKTAS